ncbi:MAG: cupredoxin domain-containing protein [Solirubrobacteraceae bacterium]
MIGRALLLTVPLLALGTVGCGGGDDDGGAAKATTVAPNAAGVVEVPIRNFDYEPEHLAVKVGQQIEWRNEDAVPHDVATTDSDEFKSPSLDKGETFRWTPREAAELTYECTFHANMRGYTITVEE